MNSITIYNKVSKENLDKKILKSDKLILIEFGSSWCGSNQIMEPIINDLLKMYEEVMDVVRIDIEQNQDMAQEYGIEIIPSYIFIKNGEIVDHLFHSASKTVFENMIKSHLSIK